MKKISCKFWLDCSVPCRGCISYGTVRNKKSCKKYLFSINECKNKKKEKECWNNKCTHYNLKKLTPEELLKKIKKRK